VTNRIRQAEKIAEWSKKDLIYARYWAKLGHPKAKKEGREMARAAKRRRTRAGRRAKRAFCKDWE